MADSTTNVDTVAASQAAKDVTVDELVDALSPALTFGRHASECAGLVWGYYGGRFNISGSPTAVVNGTLTLTASATCYVRVNSSTGVVDFVTSAPAGWPAPTGYFALYEIVVGTDAPTSWIDLRPWNSDTGGGGGGGITALTGDVTASGSGSVVATIANDAVTNAKLANMANNTYKGRRTAGTGDPEDVSIANIKTDLGLTGTNSGDQTITLTSDVTGSGTGSFATTIAANAVTNAKAAQMSAHTFKGNNTGSTANAIDLTATQATAELNDVVGDTGTGGTKGLAPAPAAGDGAAGKYLSAGGGYSVPPGTVTTPVTVPNGGTGDTTLTAHGVLVGEGTSAVAVTSAGSSGQPLLSGGASADPNWGTLSVAFGGTGDTTLTNHGVLVGQATGAVAATAAGTSGVPLIGQGSSADPVFGTAIVAGGGTGDTTLTNHGVLIGQGTSAVAVTSAGTAGQVLTSGGASADPTWANTTSVGGMARIAQVITSGSQATITFSSIPATYTDLKIILTGRDTSSSVDDSNFRILFNGDTTGGNYTATQNLGVKATVSILSTIVADSNGVAIGLLPGTSSIAAPVGVAEITIPLYAGTTFQKQVIGMSADHYNTANLIMMMRTATWLNTAAINSITLTAGGTAFLNGSTATLYGMG